MDAIEGTRSECSSQNWMPYVTKIEWYDYKVKITKERIGPDSYIL